MPIAMRTHMPIAMPRAMHVRTYVRTYVQRTSAYSLRNRYRFLTAAGGKTTGNGDGGVV